MRAIVHLLSTELFGRSMPISAFPVRPDIRGIGLSDWIGYAAQLPHKLNYSNTYYHQEPRLDITVIDPALEGTLDFLISTDVFEHVAPPVSICFENSYRLLKPNGVLILSVPYDLGPATREHFPELHDYQIVHQDDKPILIDVTADGRRQVFEDLVFHGGEGETLEMRYFSETGLLAELKKAGFQCIKIHHEPALAYGIYWHDRQQLPITARKG
jgi:SAM-dependent methyltransferase